MLLDGLRGVYPEFGRHHLGHVATETVDALGCPEQQDVGHLLPCVRHGVEVPYASGIVVDTIVQLDRLVPVVLSGGVVEMVVARSLGRLLDIGLCLAFIEVEGGVKPLVWTIIEIVLGIETVFGVIRFAQVLDALGLTDAVILASHVVGHKVDDDFQSGSVSTNYHFFKLSHASVDADSQVGIYVIIVGDGVRRASTTFHHSGMLSGDAVFAINGLCGVSDDASVPYMCDTHADQAVQHGRTEIGKLATAVLGDSAVFLTCCVPIVV